MCTGQMTFYHEYIFKAITLSIKLIALKLCLLLWKIIFIIDKKTNTTCSIIVSFMIN